MLIDFGKGYVRTKSVAAKNLIVLQLGVVWGWGIGRDRGLQLCWCENLEPA